MGGAVICLGVSANQMQDPRTPPKGATGPFVVSGNNRYCFDFLVSCRWVICLELIKAKHAESEGRLRKFWMEVYCFPDIGDKAQRLVIRQIGSEENELQATFIKMCDADKLVTCRKNLADVSDENLQGMFHAIINFF